MRKSGQSVLNHPSKTLKAFGAWRQQWVAVLVAPWLVFAAHAADLPLAKGAVQGAGDVQVTAADVTADVQRIPAEVRPQVLTKTATMNQLVMNLYTRRALAQRAQAEGLAQAPEVAAALALARDKVLSDALLVKIDKSNTPPDVKAEALARTMYQAQPADFAQPERVQVRHILIASKGKDSDAAAKAQAEDLLKQIRAGGDFAALAKAHSADPGSADKGGDLGFFAAGRMVPEFEHAAAELKNPGDVSDLVKTQFGYHIVQLIARKPKGQQSFDEVKEALMAKVRQSEQQKGRNELARTLEDTAKLDETAIKATVNKLVAPSAPPAATPAKP